MRCKCFSGVVTSLCGDDAFYRDAHRDVVFHECNESRDGRLSHSATWHDCDEGDESRDTLFVEASLLERARERLKRSSSQLLSPAARGAADTVWRLAGRASKAARRRSAPYIPGTVRRASESASRLARSTSSALWNGSDLAVAREQVHLKQQKTSAFASLFGFALKRHTPRLCTSNASTPDSSPTFARGQSPSVQSVGPTWVGKTIAEKPEGQHPTTGDDLCWQKGDGKGLEVRTKPSYIVNGYKTWSQGAMYDCISCDCIKADGKIEGIIDGLIPFASLPIYDSCSFAGEGDAFWKSIVRLPRIICVNLKLPYASPVNPFAKDDGCSLVCIFHIRPETVCDARQKCPPPHIRVLQAFFEGPSGSPGCPATDPDRSLGCRLDKDRKKDQQDGIFKLIGRCENIEDVSVPSQFRKYNGKPCLITQSGYIVKSPNAEWVEVGIDVRGFNPLARQMLHTCRDTIPRAAVHFGFLIQVVDDEDMPEMLIGDVYAFGLNIMKDPYSLE